MRVRQAGLDDLDRLCAIRNNEQLFQAYLEECDGERAYFLVAEVDSLIIGFALVYLDVTKNGKRKSHLPKLSDLYVVGDWRRQGIAEMLVRAREKIAKDHGYSQIYVSIDPDESIAMIALAQKLDYRPLQTEPYGVTAIYHDTAGQSYPRRYRRIDFVKQLV